MEQYLVFAVLGLGAGAVYAALGVGLVMTSKGAGVVNFAHAALGMWGAFVFAELRESGELVVPMIGLPARIPLGSPQPNWLALVLAVLTSALIGALVQLLVFRPLRHAPLVARLIASLGLMTLFQSLVFEHFGHGARNLSPILPNDPIHVGTLSFPADRLWLAVAVMVLAVLIALIYRRTLFGLATRASLEDEAAFTLSGWSPTLLAVANVAAGVALTTFVMILAAPVSPLNPESLSLLVVPGLTAMLVGRLISVTAAAAAGLALGVVQSELTFVQTKTWWPTSLTGSGVADAVPLVVIVVTLVLVGRSLPTRAGIVLEPMPRVPPPMRPRTIGAMVVALGLVAIFVSPGIRHGINVTMIFAILALSLVILVGLVGQISLGQLAIAGIAAFVLVPHLDSWPFPLGLLVAAVVAAVLAVVVGLPALRVRGAQLAVVTLASAAAVQAAVFNNVSTQSIKSPHFAGIDLSPQIGSSIARLQFTFTLVVFLAIACLASSKIIGGSLGRRFLAVRNNEQAAASLGISVAATKVLALAISGLLAGVGGGLLAYNEQALSGASFSVFASVSLLVYAYIGGITGIGGALYAGVLAPFGAMYVLMNEVWDLGSSTYEIIAAIGLILVAIFNPQGIGDAMRVSLGWVRRRLGDGHGEKVRPLRLPAAEAASPLPLSLFARNVTVHYGGVTAVDGVDIEVNPGEIVGLIGPNGAGKTSLLDALTGFAPAEGVVTLGEQELSNLNPHVRYRRGLGRTWQAGQLFEDLTVYDNVRVAVAAGAAAGHEAGGSGLSFRSRRQGRAGAQAAWAMALVGISDLANRRPSEISGGQRKLVGLARALSGRPSVLLADEPAAGLDSFESQQLGERLRTVAEAGVGVLLIEHDLALVLSLCDRIYVLSEGRLIASGAPDQIREDPVVVSAYIGDAHVHQETS